MKNLQKFCSRYLYAKQMAKDESLTAEQQVMLKEHYDRFLEVGLFCNEVDWETAETNIQILYQKMKKKTAPWFFRFSSPAGATLAGNIIPIIFSAKNKIKADPKEALFASDEFVENFQREFLREIDRCMIEAHKASDSEREEIKRRFLAIRLTADVVKKFELFGSLGGQYEIYWIFYFTFCKMIGAEYKQESDELLGVWEQIANSCACFYPFESGCFISDHPLAIHRSEENQLHHDGGPAVEFRDGWKTWFLNGVRVPQWLAKTKMEEIDPGELTKIENVDIRREFVRKVGIDRICFKLAETIDSEDNYELLLLNIETNDADSGDKNRRRRRPYLKMMNPSLDGVWHVEGVHPDCKTVKQALEWRNGTEETPEVLT